MKHLAITAAAVFLLAAPVYAQSDNNNNNADNTNKNGGQTGGNDMCNDTTPNANYAAFSEKCRAEIDHWAATQTGKGVTFEGDVAVGAVLPETVEIIEVPAYKSYGYVMLNDHRVLVDRTTRKVVRVY